MTATSHDLTLLEGNRLVGEIVDETHILEMTITTYDYYFPTTFTSLTIYS